MPQIVTYWIVSAIICGIVTGIVGSSKGRDGFGWFVVGCLLGIFGIILIALVPSLIPAQVQISGEWSAPPQAADTGTAYRPSIARQSGSVGALIATSPQKGYDTRKWEVLKEVDAEISGVAFRIAALDPRLEDELAEKYLTLNDKTYLATLELQLTDKFRAEREKSQALMESIGKDHAESSLKQMAHYNELLSANDQKDPYENVKVVKVEPYVGKWQAAQGGIKVTFENGQIQLICGAFKRRFASEAETF